ncbi:hydrogenase maturation nickel metallochaperone HypA/HybF [Leptolyngbya ohadii]|uniref:hydrogenase maturation nickel metallochaperone HypA/HybF n=1 Tax=Leptolyngbya ohadii TaxID=1962290 RepID=UPI000B59B0A3|nr:hydrogenase maturation nickel metallochaperone HypA [Leptolyngbya ohadii]
MHELGITQNIVAIVSEHADGSNVNHVVIEIGELSAILPEAVQFCFDVCARGTLVEGATLEIIEVPGIAECRVCGHSFAIDRPFGICHCGSRDIAIVQGEELNIKSFATGETEELCA